MTAKTPRKIVELKGPDCSEAKFDLFISTPNRVRVEGELDHSVCEALFRDLTGEETFNAQPCGWRLQHKPPQNSQLDLIPIHAQDGNSQQVGLRFRLNGDLFIGHARHLYSILLEKRFHLLENGEPGGLPLVDEFSNNQETSGEMVDDQAHIDWAEEGMAWQEEKIAAEREENKRIIEDYERMDEPVYDSNPNLDGTLPVDGMPEENGDIDNYWNQEGAFELLTAEQQYHSWED